MKEIGRCYKYIVKAIDGLNTQMMEQMITPEKLTNRFCGNLGLANLEFLKLATAVIATFRSLRITEGKFIFIFYLYFISVCANMLTSFSFSKGTRARSNPRRWRRRPSTSACRYGEGKPRLGSTSSASR